MQARTVALIAVIAALGILVLGGAALASGAMGPSGSMGWMGRGGYGNNAPGTPGSQPMHGGYEGPGGMMGSGPGGMMGGSQGTQSATGTPAVGVTQVNIQNFAFQPAVIQVAKGATVTWTNQDSAPHTVTFRDSGMTGSGTLQRGQSFSYTFSRPGAYTYYCGVHPSMTGTVTVTP